MLPITTIVYLFLMFLCLLGSIFSSPIFGVIGYIGTYNINPGGQWWGIVVTWFYGLRYAMFMAIVTGLGIIIHRPKLKFKRFFESQEILLIIFLAIIWLSNLMGISSRGESSLDILSLIKSGEFENNSIKMTKVVIIIMMASHIVTDLRKYEAVIWTLIISGFYLGLQSYLNPQWYGGRLEGWGAAGSDFSEANFLGAHYAILLPFIGAMFMKGSWRSKIICLVSGIFVANAFILGRSRGDFLAMLIGLIFAIIFSIPGSRRKIFFWVSIAIVGSLFLVDPMFKERMSSIEFEKSEMDGSSFGRMEIWKGSLSMALDNPLGVGEGNFKENIGRYIPYMGNRDTHNTLLRCFTELGVQGGFVLLLLIYNAFRILFKLKGDIKDSPNKNDFLWHIYSLKIALIIFLVAGIFITHTYIEEFYWLLMFPIFLKRSVENENDSLQNRHSKGEK